MINTTAKISSTKFISVCLGLLERTCEIIREVHLGSVANKKIQFKEGDDPVTIADLRSAWIIDEGLAHHFPGIFIIGEEGPNGIASEFSFAGIDTNSFAKFGFPEREFELEKCTVFVDPLDATRAFVKGNLSGVTCLITLAYENKPVIGLIGYPSATPRPYSEEFNTQTEIVVGLADHPRVLNLGKLPTASEYEIFEEFLPFNNPTLTE